MRRAELGHPAVRRPRDLLGRLFGGKAQAADHIHATVVAPGGALRPGGQAILRVYIQRDAEGRRPGEAGNKQTQTAHVIRRSVTLSLINT